MLILVHSVLLLKRFAVINYGARTKIPHQIPEPWQTVHDVCTEDLHVRTEEFINLVRATGITCQCLLVLSSYLHAREMYTYNI